MSLSHVTIKIMFHLPNKVPPFLLVEVFKDEELSHVPRPFEPKKPFACRLKLVAPNNYVKCAVRRRQFVGAGGQRIERDVVGEV